MMAQLDVPDVVILVAQIQQLRDDLKDPSAGKMAQATLNWVCLSYANLLDRCRKVLPDDVALRHLPNVMEGMTIQDVLLGLGQMLCPALAMLDAIEEGKVARMGFATGRRA
jgi:hypothetical protein